MIYMYMYMKLEAKGDFQATKKQPKYAPDFIGVALSLMMQNIIITVFSRY